MAEGEPSMAAAAATSEATRRTEEGSAQAQLPKTDPPHPNPTFVGRHRLAAAIAHLNNQINILQEELDQLDTTGKSSTVCRELVPSVESIPDPLLPMTRGPGDAGWDRWFRGDNGSRKNKRWI